MRSRRFKGQTAGSNRRVLLIRCCGSGSAGLAGQLQAGDERRLLAALRPDVSPLTEHSASGDFIRSAAILHVRAAAAILLHQPNQQPDRHQSAEYPRQRSDPCRDVLLLREQCSKRRASMSKAEAKSKDIQHGPIHYPLWFGGSASCFAACVTHPLDLSKSRGHWRVRRV